MGLELPIGSTFAGHRIDAVAGRGGMGVVYRATDLALDRPVALKLIASELADDRVFRARFERECRSAAAIDHPNVVQVFHAGEEQGLLYVTMRYVEGSDLRTLLEDEGRLAPARAVELVAQVAAALDEAHAKGLVHRDVKPANVLLAPRGGREHAFLTDFGVTKQRTAEDDLTRTGFAMGTADFMAPEQAQGKELDGRADVYALACVLFRALTGELPFERDSDLHKMWAHVSDPPPSPREMRPELPRALDAAIRRALAKDPQDRPESAGAFAEEALAALGLAAPPSPVPTPAAGSEAVLRVVVAEDSPLLRAGVVRVLEEAGFAVVGEAGDGEELLRAVRAHRPDVAVTDIRMPPTNTDEGLRAARTIREEMPGTGVLVLSQYVEQGYALDLIGDSAQGVGYLLKDRVADLRTFADAVRQVGQGGSALDPEVVAQMLAARRTDSPLKSLTEREREVLGLMAEGHSDEAIGETLGLAARAVEGIVTSIFEKLELGPGADGHRRVQAVLAYLRTSHPVR